MTNQKTEEIMEVWTNLKTQCLKFKFFLKNKELIREAVEMHLNYSSSFQRDDERTAPYDMPSDWEWQGLTEPTKEIVEGKTAISPEWIEYDKKRVWNAYVIQREKNKKIAEECREFLKKFKEMK